MKHVILFTLFVLSFNSYAKIKTVPLNELIKHADHVVVGTISKVDMIAKSGKEIKDEDAHNGNIQGSSIRIHFEIASDAYIKTNGSKEKRTVTIPLARHRILSLKNAKSSYKVGNKHILLLKGKEYSAVANYWYLRDMNEKKNILKLLNK